MKLVVENLEQEGKLLVLLSILLDGEAAPLYLSPGNGKSSQLQEACKELAKVEPELRVALSGTLLRAEIAKLKSG